MDAYEFAERSEKIKARLYRAALLYLGGEAQALDAVGETIYKGLKHLKELRQSEFFETWLTRILINECKTQLRRKKREQPPDFLPEAAWEEFDSLSLRDAISRLPKDLREVIILRYFADLTLAQTAQSLELPQGTVVTRQRRALALLKLELLED